MATNQTKQDSPKKSPKQYSAMVPVVFVCLILSVCAIMSFSSLYSDCFGLGDFIPLPLSYVGFFDSLIIIGFIFKLNPVKFMRFVAFTVAGFALYYAWSSGNFNFAKEYFSDVGNFLFVLFVTANGAMALSHFAVGLLSYKMPPILAGIVGIIGLSAWATPLFYIIGTHLSK